MSRAGGGRPTTSWISRTLTIRKFAEAGLFKVAPGQHALISTFWNSGETREDISLAAEIAQCAIHIHARFNPILSNGKRVQVEQHLTIVATAQPFGGRRWWFVCPGTGRRVLTLYRPLWSRMWASRHQHRLAYSSTRQSARDRALMQSHRLRRMLDPETEFADPTPDRPKGMWARTYDQHCARIDAQEERIDAFLFLTVERMRARERSKA